MKPLLTSRFSRRGSPGQSLVEFALIIPIFLFILFGLIDLGTYAFTNNILSQAAREGARVASTQANWIGKTTADEPTCNDPGGPICPSAGAFITNVQTAVRNASSGLTSPVTVYVRCDDAASSPPTTAWTTGSCASNHDTGDKVSVRLEYTFRPLTPVGRLLLTQPTQTGSATMIID
jgi:Flp pilus assembly protein TadG